MEESAELTHVKPKPRKKRRFAGWCVAFVRWVFIILFAVILLGGLYFKAPWKILTLDAILLALLTVIPKSYRKYGWLTLATAVLAVTVWIFIPEKNTGNWKPHTFDKEIRAYNAKYAVPDEENAATILEKISLKYEDTFYRWPDFSKTEKPDDPNVAMEIIMQQIRLRCADFYPDCWTDKLDELTLNQSWKSNDYPQLAEWLNQKNDDIILLMKASKKTKCQFEYTFNPFPSSTFNDDPSYAIYEWVKLLRRTANNDWGDGRIDDAIEKYNALFRLGNLLSQEPLWSLAMQGMRLSYDVHKSLSHFIIENDFNKNQLNALEETIGEIQDPDFDLLFERWFEYQRLSMKQLWASMYEINEHGKTRYARSVPDKFLKHSFKVETQKTRLKEQKEKLRNLFTWFFIPTTPQMMARQIDAGYDRVSNISLEEMKSEIENHKLELNFRFFATGPLMISQIKGLYGIYERTEFIKLYRNVYRVYIALRRYKNDYGVWPDRLSQLNDYAATEDIFIDPYNDGLLVYKKTGDDFILYSNGKNGIDEDGHFQRPIYDPNKMTKDEHYRLEPEPDDILIWPEELK